ncbi:precorrin-6A reductase [Methylopila jiangsuensis]|uniref:Precorrin-6A reductase n=1 Tax=Methylopila jiangsuensis TaxID=586230 RepID=A0A9W6JFW3_9HYPH|nr:cobalt-precorrin-6A reductase [Methylopila jiangsuensis]MDR6285511.1 precorrin-6A/cobalt-precorrin-6A reductase [Methylopila jiangsuensis]GLK75269.1 precorrin-6A reductase [Methylopila jiangsuensis]
MTGAAPSALVLGGSSEGFAVAARLHALGFDVVTSFAGRTERRRTPEGRTRVGGFGGVEGLAAYLMTERPLCVIDATHPFAARMKANAAEACRRTGTPLTHVERPAWTPRPGDDWRPAADVAEAAALIPATDGPCLVTVGRQELAPFATRTDVALLLRMIDPLEAPFPHPRATIVLDRGPFGLDAERRLFDAHGVASVVAKNSGGDAARAKLDAARERGLPVVMIGRPPRPAGQTVPTPDAAAAWAARLVAERGARLRGPGAP